MSYEATRAAIFTAAGACVRTGKTTLTTGRLTTRQDAERAFQEWLEAGGSRLISMRMTTTANGDVAAEFTPPSERVDDRLRSRIRAWLPF